jgi:hypothetical protein
MHGSFEGQVGLVHIGPLALWERTKGGLGRSLNMARCSWRKANPHPNPLPTNLQSVPGEGTSLVGNVESEREIDE